MKRHSVHIIHIVYVIYRNRSHFSTRNWSYFNSNAVSSGNWLLLFRKPHVHYEHHHHNYLHYHHQQQQHVFHSQVCLLYVVRRHQLLGLESLPSDIGPVVDAYERALLASYPRLRYLVGCDAFLMAILAKLPEFIGDWVLAKRLQLPSCAVP